MSNSVHCAYDTIPPLDGGILLQLKLDASLILLILADDSMQRKGSWDDPPLPTKKIQLKSE